MQYVFKRRRKTNGRTQVAQTWTGRYQLPWMDRPKNVALGVKNKRAAERIFDGLVQQAEREHAGIALPKTLVQAASESLLVHLDHFAEDLSCRDKNAQYISDVRGRVKRLVVECGWVKLPDVTPSDFLTWRNSKPRCLRGNGLMSAKTLNDYLATMKAFLAWLVDQGKLLECVLVKIKSIDARGMEKTTRRALSEDEARRLMMHVGKRASVYATALETGYRRGTLYALRWEDLDLDSPTPRITPR